MRDHFVRGTIPTGTYEEVAARKATCGACGSEREVSAFMLKDKYQQFTARPGEPTDQFYCRCQDLY